MTVMLKRTFQTGMKIQSVAGTAETLVAADYAGNNKDSSHQYEPGEYDRALERGTLTKQGMLKGTQLGQMSHTCEVVGGAAATEAPWHRRLQSMGFSTTGLKKTTVGSVSGTPVLGETFGNHALLGSATKTGMVVALIGGTTLIYLPLTGTIAAADSLTFYISTATATTSGSPAAAGYAFKPQTETAASPTAIATIERRGGGELHQLSDAVGKGTLSFRVNEPALLQGEYHGIPRFDGSTRPATATAMTGISAVGVAPKMTKGMPVRYGSSYTPILSKVEIAIENTFANRFTIADNQIGASGCLGVRISDRKINLVIDPENDLTGNSLDVVAKTMLGTTVAISGSLGLTTDTNGQVIFYAPAAQIVGNHQPGDRDGIVTVDPTMELTGDQDDELYIFHVFS